MLIRHLCFHKNKLIKWNVQEFQTNAENSYQDQVLTLHDSSMEIQFFVIQYL